MTTADYARARRLLMRRDPILAVTIRRIGACGMTSRLLTDHLTTLVRAIVGQQLSSKAAATIFGRLCALFPDGQITVDGLQALGDTPLRGVGLSSQKLAYLRDLSARIADRRLLLDELDELSDEQVIERLTAVKGFGRWTAEMFLMFRLQRPDVLPVGDLGICTAVQRIYRLRQRPKPMRLIKIGEAWRPYRSIACWYLWESLKLGAAGPGLPRRSSEAILATKAGTKPSPTEGRSRRRSRLTSRAR
jgi:DNA-3-methyladenine glycosylase II